MCSSKPAVRRKVTGIADAQDKSDMFLVYSIEGVAHHELNLFEEYSSKPTNPEEESELLTAQTTRKTCVAVEIHPILLFREIISGNDFWRETQNFWLSEIIQLLFNLDPPPLVKDFWNSNFDWMDAGKDND